MVQDLGLMGSGSRVRGLQRFERGVLGFGSRVYSVRVLGFLGLGV